MNHNRIIFIGFIVGLIFLIALGAKLRLYHYQTVPLPGESRDEYSFGWLGLSLLTAGQPIATSGLPAYQHQYAYINVDNVYKVFGNQNPFPIDSPWFDHPPLFSLIPGGYLFINGTTTFADSSIVLIRKPMIALGVVNLIGVMYLGYLLKGRLASLIAGALYATDPLIVISSRMAQAENLLITMFLGMIISFWWYQKTQRELFLGAAISLAGLSMLVKLSGISVVATLVLLIVLFVEQRRVKTALVAAGGSLVIALLFPLYGLFYDWRTFVAVFQTNSVRVFADGFSAGMFLLTRQNITRDLTSGLVPLGWISAAILAGQWKQQKSVLYLVLPLFCYLIVFLLLGSENYGWYKFPFLPFLVIAVAWAFVEACHNVNSIYLALFFLLPGGVLLHRVITPEVLQTHMTTYRLGLLLGGSAILAPLLFGKRARMLFVVCMTLGFLAIIGLQCYTVYQITPERWYDTAWLKVL